MSEDVKLLIENLQEVKFPDQYYEYAQLCRESYYYIKSVKGLLDYHVVLKESYDLHKIERMNSQVEQLVGEFHEMDNKHIDSRVSRIEDNVDARDLTRHIELDEIFDNTISYIELKAKFDKLQCEILEYLYQSDHKLYNKIVERFDDSNQIIIQHEYQKLMMSVNNHSADEDKIINISFVFEDEEVKEYLISMKKEGFFKFKVRDYSHRLNLARKIYEFERTEAIKLLGMIQSHEDEKMWKDINLQQFELNKKMTSLTYISAFVAFTSMVIAGMSLYISFMPK